MRPGRRAILNSLLDEERIFNRDDCAYAPVERFASLRKSTGGVRAVCELADGSRETLTFTFLAGGVLRARFGEKKAGPYNAIQLDLPKIATRVRYDLHAERPTVSVGKVRLVLDKATGTFAVFRGRDVLIDSSEPNERAWFGHISWQLGRGRLQDGTEFTWFSSRLRQEECVYGGGEQFSELNARGRRLKGWITDTLGLNSTPLHYKWVPFFMTSRKAGVYFNSPAKATSELGSASFTAMSHKFAEPTLEFFIFTSDSLKGILADYSGLTGRAPSLPMWSYGIWLSRCAYRDRAEVEQAAAEAREVGFPADVIHIDPTWLTNREKYNFNACDFVWNHERFPEPESMIQGLHAKGFRVSLWINPYLWLQTGPAHAHPDMLLRDAAGDVAFTPLSTQQAIYDFTHADARRFYRRELDKLLAMGVDVFKTDYGENVPAHARFHCGESGTVMHNLYPYLYNREVYEATRAARGDDAMVWGRSGFAGSQRFPVGWSGDCQATWDVAGQVLCAGLNAGMSGLPHWSCDIGGFVGQPDDELFVRWAQFGLLTSHARFHGNGFREPWRFGKRAHAIVRRFADLRYQLITYLHDLGLAATRTGLPVIRSMALEFEDDPVCRTLSSQYMLGNALLVRPVFEPGATSAQVYLPEGRWLDFYSRKVYAGPGFIDAPAPLDRIPLFQRANTAIPLNGIMPHVDPTMFETLRVRAFDSEGGACTFAVPGRRKLAQTFLPKKAGLRVVTL